MSIRRCFQFRLRTLLAGMSVLCVALVISQHLRHAHQLDAMLKQCDIEFVAVGIDGTETPISALKAKYASAVGHEFHLRRYKPEWRYCGVYSVHAVTDEEISLLPASSSLRRIVIPHTSLTALGYARLAHFPGLRVLNLDSCEHAPTAQCLEALTELTELRINGLHIDRGALAPLRNMPHLTILDLSLHGLSHISGSTSCLQRVDLEAIGNSRNLEQLFVSANLEDDDVQCFSRLSRLKTLSLPGNRLTRKTFCTIGKLTALEDLDLEHIEDVEGELRHLSSLRYLRRLSLVHTSLTPGGLAPLAKLPGLTELDLSNATARDGKLDDELADLPALTHLRKLNLFGCEIDDDAVAVLARMNWLDELSIQYTDITTWNGLDTLQTSLPSTRITR